MGKNAFENILTKVVSLKVGNSVYENCTFKKFMHNGKTMMFWSKDKRINVSIPTIEFIEQAEAAETV